MLSTWRIPANRYGMAVLSACVCAGLMSTIVAFNILHAQFYEEPEDVPEEHGLEINSENGLPSNITGYYRGSWEGGVRDRRFQYTRFVHGEKGFFDVHLRSGPERTSGLRVVKEGVKYSAKVLDGSGNASRRVVAILTESSWGSLTLRTGLHTEDDFRLKVDGVYVWAVGRIHAQLKPNRPLVIRMTKQETEDKINAKDYRAALRNEAERWARTPHPFLKYGVAAEDQLDFRKECELILDVSLSLADSNKTDDLLFGMERKLLAEAEEKLPLSIIGSLYSPNCNISMAVNATSFPLEHFYAKHVHYTLGATIVSFIQILLLIKQMKETWTPSAAMRVSMFCICQQAAIDAFLCLLHLTAGILNEPLFNAFAMASFFEFVLFAIFEMRYMLLVWRAQRGQSLDPWDTRRELSVLYTRFYAVLLGGILFMYRFYQYIHVLFFVLYSFWVPQIVRCIREDVRQPLKPGFVIGMTITRLLFPLYIFGCPKNLIGMTPNPVFCIALSLYMAFQVSLLFLQHFFGPHCFVPKRFLPDKHDYFRNLDNEELDQLLGEARGDEETGHSSTIECVICMSQVDVRRPRNRMITPCEHFFHPQCLQRWMDVKMECPTCRQPLPPL